MSNTSEPIGHWLNDDPTGPGSGWPGAESVETQARRVRAALRNVSSTSTSSVVAIRAPWGRGKTSVLERTIALVDDAYYVVRFDVWRFADSTSLHLDFFRVLVGGLPLKATQARLAIAKLASHAAPFGQMASLVGVDGSAPVQKIADLVAGGVSPEALSERLARELARLDRSVLVVVDDIDRLSNATISALLRVVRLHGRVPGINFLLAYDRRVVEAAVESDQRPIDGESFLDKIVQAEVALPPIRERVKNQWFDRAFDELWPANMPRVTESEYNDLAELFATLILPSLATPRQLRRFFTESLSGLAERGREVDLQDWFTIVWLRLRHARLHDWIWAEKPFLLAPHWSFIGIGDDSKRQMEVDKSLRERLTRADLDSASEAVRVLRSLFPALDGKQRSERPRRLQDAVYFDRYFDSELAADEFSVQAFDDAIEELRTTGGSTALTSMAVSEMDGFFDRIGALAATPLDFAPKLYMWLGEVYPALPRETSGELVFSAQRRADVIGADLLRLANASAREEIRVAIYDGTVAESFAAESTLRAIPDTFSSRDIADRHRYAMDTYGVDVTELARQLLARGPAEQPLALPGADWQLITTWSWLASEDCRAAVLAMVDSGAWSAESLVARFTGTSKIMGVRGAPWRIDEYRTRDLDQFVGIDSMLERLDPTRLVGVPYRSNESVTATAATRTAHALAVLGEIARARNEPTTDGAENPQSADPP